MYILGIDSTTRAASAALFCSGKLVSCQFVNNQLTHSETLLPMIKSVVQAAGIEVNQLSGIGVAKGPGSFTGVRIGVTIAKTLSQVLNIPLVGIPTLDVLAQSMIGCEGLVVPILDARKQEVYTALYEVNHGLNLISEYKGIAVEKLVEELEDYNKTITFVGDGVVPYGEILEAKLGSKAVIAPATKLWPNAAYVAELANAQIGAGQDDGWQQLVPYYIRVSEAEATWAKKHGE